MNDDIVDANARLKHFPITFFAVVLGFAGYTLAFLKTEEMLKTGHTFSYILLFVSLALLTTVLLFYSLKGVKYPQSVSLEFMHPVRINFFPLLAKILLVISIVFLSINENVSFYFWMSGTLIQFIASIVIVSTWIQHTHFKIEHMTPAWFIPIVGSIMVPVAGVKHGFTEMSWFFFSTGLIFWIMLFIIVMYRLIFHPPIVEKLLPTMFIMFAPPAIGFISYIKLTGSLDPFAKVLFYISLFMLMIVLFRFKDFIKIKFYLSWWAYTFPLAAVTISSILMFNLTQNSFFKFLALFELGLLTIIIPILVFRTLSEVRAKKLCVEEK
jgi:tellurite resistance protein